MKIKELRQKLNYSQSKVSKDLNIPEQTLYGWENGSRQPSIENLIILSNYYHISIDELVGRETNNLNLNLIDNTRRNLIIEILNAKDSTVDRLDAFYQGIKLAELERENITNKLKGNRNDN